MGMLSTAETAPAHQMCDLQNTTAKQRSKDCDGAIAVESTNRLDR